MKAGAAKPLKLRIKNTGTIPITGGLLVLDTAGFAPGQLTLSSGSAKTHAMAAASADNAWTVELGPKKTAAYTIRAAVDACVPPGHYVIGAQLQVPATATVQGFALNVGTFDVRD